MRRRDLNDLVRRLGIPMNSQFNSGAAQFGSETTEDSRKSEQAIGFEISVISQLAEKLIRRSFPCAHFDQRAHLREQEMAAALCCL